MENEKVKVEHAKIDELTLEEMAKKVIKGTSSAKQMARTELVFYMELFEQMKKFNENIETLARIETIIHKDEILDALGKPKMSNCTGKN